MFSHFKNSYDCKENWKVNCNPEGCKKVHSRAAGSHIWIPRRPIGEREAWRHDVAVVGSFMPSIRKSWRLLRWLRNCLVRQLHIGGGSARAGGGGGVS
jgi:hypothetical protein